ncbi:MAG: GntR family transcriptional regulator [Hungatella sp.]|nr:GntR family transcriptional regulator [Hungatella sp.]
MDLKEESYKLNKEIPIPLYYQIKRIILNDLSSGKLKEGDALPTETEFCDSLQVSRPTVRQALNELVAEGVLMRRKKSGTFVAQPKIELPVNLSVEDLKRHIENTGRDCKVEILDFCVIDGADEVNNKLRLHMKEDLIYLKRMWLAGGTPVAYTAAYLAAGRFGAMMDSDFTDINLPDYLECHFGLHVTKRETRVDSTLASKFDLELLQINRTRASLLCVNEVAKAGDEPVFCSVTRYRGDKVSMAYSL